jgi:hypothetical protein
MDWIDETQDRGQWRIFVNTEVNFQVEWHFEKFLTRRANGSSFLLN